MSNPFLNSDGLNETIASGMSEGFVDVEKLNTLRLIILIDCFQTGNVAEKRWSCQAAKNKDSVLSLQILGERKAIPFFIVGFESGK